MQCNAMSVFVLIEHLQRKNCGAQFAEITVPANGMVKKTWILFCTMLRFGS